MKLIDKDLMVGDWVYRPDCYDKVKEIRENGIIGRDYLRGIISFKELEPIPLTPEILEKNGFYFGYTSSMEDSINNISHDYPIIMPEETWCWDEGDGEITIDFPTEADGGLITVEYADKRMEFLFDDEVYVHQLQHALKDCGIDKEIDLNNTEN